MKRKAGRDSAAPFAAASAGHWCGIGSPHEPRSASCHSITFARLPRYGLQERAFSAMPAQRRDASKFAALPVCMSELIRLARSAEF
jgi:hypothetical protein